MWKIPRDLLLLFSCVSLVSCASERKVTYSKAEARNLDKFKSDVEFATNKEGQAVWKNEKRSQFDSQAGFGGTKDFKSKSYAKHDFTKKKWGQESQFAKQAYQGNKDGSRYQRSPYFASKQTAEQGQLARGREKKYASSSYREAEKLADTGRDFAKPEDVETNVRRRVYKAPSIQNSDGYNGLSVDEANSLLGR